MSALEVAQLKLAVEETKKLTSKSPEFDKFIWHSEKKWIQIVCVLTFIMVPMFGVIDFLIIPPEHLAENLLLFFLLRCGASILVFFQFMILKQSGSNRWNTIHGYILTFVLGTVISVMTMRLGGFTSSYFNGIGLVLVGVNLLLPWNAWKGAFNSVFIIAPYLAVNLLFGPPYENLDVLSNLSFILGTAGIAVIIAHVKFGLTKAEFEKMVVINELKTQTDADYFLTSLILKPLSQNLARSESISVEFFTKQKKKFSFKSWQDEIGGDICVSNNITLKGKRYIVFVNADAMGKSMQGAGGALVFGAVFQALVQRTKSVDTSQDQHPERWLKSAVTEMQRTFESFDGLMMISMVIGLVEEKSGVLYYINAEHPFPVLYRDSKASFTDSEVFPKVGMLGMSTRLFVTVLPMRAGDSLIFGSDGRDDLMVTNPETGGRAVIDDDDFFLKATARNAGELKAIAADLETSGDMIDDLSLLKLSFQPKESAPVDVNWRGKVDGLVDGARLDAVREWVAAGIMTLSILKEAVAISLKHGEIDEAVRHAKKIIDRYPAETRYLYFLAREFYKQKNYPEAIEFGERFRNRQPDHVNNLMVLSNSYRLTNHPERARTLLEEVLEAEPTSRFAPDIRESLALADAHAYAHERACESDPVEEAPTQRTSSAPVRNTARESHKAALWVVWFMLIIPAFGSVHADIVILKSGRSINGRIRTEEAGHLFVLTLEGERKVPEAEIDRVEIGYSGLSFCIVPRDNRPKDCDGVLHLLLRNSIVLGTGNGLTHRREIRRDAFARIEFRKAAEGQRILPAVTKGIELDLTVKNPAGGEMILRGTVMESNLERLTVRLADGSLRELSERDLIAGIFGMRPAQNTYQPPPFLLRLLPGGYQMWDGSYFKGSLFFLGFSALGAGLAASYSAARTAERNASNSLTFLLFYDQEYQAKARRYQRVQRGIGAAAVVLYALHLIDAFGGRPGAETTVAFFSPPAVTFADTRHGNGNASPEMEFVRLTFRF